MNLTWPSHRNSFHAAWLLLLVPPSLGLTLASFSPSTALDLSLVLRLALATVIIIPVIWWRAGEASGWVRRGLKELRAQLPACLMAIVVPGLIGLWGPRDLGSAMVGTYGLGCLFMGAAAFGSEFEQRTIGGLLAQPLPRVGIFLEKIIPLAFLLLLATANLFLSLDLSSGSDVTSGDAKEIVAVALFALCSGPLFSLLTRSTLAGLIFSITVPPILWLGADLVVRLVFRGSHPDEPFPDEWETWLFAAGASVYLLTTFVSGWSVFQRLQIRDGGAGGRVANGLHPLSQPLDRLLGRILPSGSSNAHLVRKELRLQVLPWLVAGIMVGLWILWLALRQFATDENFKATMNQVPTLTLFASLLGLMILFGTGATCIAEERELGTLEWQLTQPASLTRQWWFKVGVAALLALILGVVLPLTLLTLGFGPDAVWTASAWGNPGSPGDVVAASAGGILLLFAMSVYASSISRNTMKAVAAAVAVVTVFWGLCAFSTWVGTTLLESILASARLERESGLVDEVGWVPSQFFLQTALVVMAGSLILIVVSALLWLAARNFRFLLIPRARLIRQLTGLSFAVLFLSVIAISGWFWLLALSDRASWADTRRRVREQLIVDVQKAADMGHINPDIYQQFGVPTNATPQVLANAVLSALGDDAVAGFARRTVRPPSPPLVHRLDPRIAARYGLVVPGQKPTAGSPTHSATTSNSLEFPKPEPSKPSPPRTP